MPNQHFVTPAQLDQPVRILQMQTYGFFQNQSTPGGQHLTGLLIMQGGGGREADDIDALERGFKLLVQRGDRKYTREFFPHARPGLDQSLDFEIRNGRNGL